VGVLFNLETISFVVQKILIPYSPICQSFLLVAELLGFHWESICLYLLLPVYTLLFSVLAQVFMSDIKVINPLWVHTSAGWQVWF
jgi:hypothetical protein